jgi:hypothetical protein
LISLDHLRERYARLADEDLLELALQGAETLTPEALELLRSELRNRELGQLIQESIDAQLSDFTPGEHAQLVERFRQLNCPMCGERTGPLNAFTVTVVRSLVFVTSWEKSLVIGCPRCIRQAASAANRRTMTLGWWGSHGVIVRTIAALSTGPPGTAGQVTYFTSSRFLGACNPARQPSGSVAGRWK